MDAAQLFLARSGPKAANLKTGTSFLLSAPTRNPSRAPLQNDIPCRPSWFADARCFTCHGLHAHSALLISISPSCQLSHDSLIGQRNPQRIARVILAYNSPLVLLFVPATWDAYVVTRPAAPTKTPRRHSFLFVFLNHLLAIRSGSPPYAPRTPC